MLLLSEEQQQIFQNIIIPGECEAQYKRTAFLLKGQKLNVVKLTISRGLQQLMQICKNVSFYLANLKLKTVGVADTSSRMFQAW